MPVSTVEDAIGTNGGLPDKFNEVSVALFLNVLLVCLVGSFGDEKDSFL